ncbi:SpoIIIAH-like family protein [Pontibacillus salicampi]|uniref:SpoIIIAH-like family protein n=1 Tax=Pontibacillus salicampi TaxID=1449801 RepID=A0ABV6LK30_9BACI
MMLKKQTVWLLTMLSLMIVLSVYYMTSPSEDQVAILVDDEQQQEQPTNADNNQDGTEGEAEAQTEGQDLASGTNSDEYFVSMRMQIEDSRARLKEELEGILSSEQVSATEANEVVAQIRQIEELNTKEDLVEQSIQAKAEYPDVLVRAQESKVFVTVKANELSKGETVTIMNMVQDEFGDNMVVDVEFQPYEQ